LIHKIAIIIRNKHILPTLKQGLNHILIKENSQIYIIKYNEDRAWREKNSYALSILKKWLNEGKIELKCGCTENLSESPSMTIVEKGETSKGFPLYHIRTFKGRIDKHSVDCFFYGERIPPDQFESRFYTENKKIKPSLLGAVHEADQNYRETPSNLLAPNKKGEKATFTKLCKGFLDKAVAINFNRANIGLSRTNNEDLKKLQLPSVKSVTKSLNALFKKKLPKIFEVYINLVTKEQIEQISKDKYKIELGGYSRIIKVNQIFGWNLEESGYAKSTGNYLIIVVRNRKTKQITRIFVQPILSIKANSIFIPIESKHEAKFARELLKHNFKFIKITTGSPIREYSRIKLPKCVGKILRYSIYQPDFIIFLGNKTGIIELLGFDDPQYRKTKEEARKEFIKLKRKNNCNEFSFEAVKSFEDFLLKINARLIH